MLGVRPSFLTGSLLLLSLLLACDGDPLFGPNAALVRPPASLTASAVSHDQIDLTWQDNAPNETGFELYRSTPDPSGPFTRQATTGSSVTNYSDAGLTPKTQYCYKVRAFKTSGPNTSYSPFSETVCATTPVIPVPAAPSGTDAKPAYSTAVDVSWIDNSGNETGFRVERSLDLGSTWTSLRTVGANVTSLQDYQVASEQRVCYRVVAFNALGDSPPSTTDCTTPPAAPTALTAAGAGGAAIDLTWADNSAAEDGYEVGRWVDATCCLPTVIANLPANATSYHDADVTINTKYWYSVRAKKDGGFSSPSNSASAIAVTMPPNAPSGTDAVPWTSTSVGVTWTDNSTNEDGFRVERSTDGGATWTPAGTTLDVGFGDGGRVSEERVCYRVIAFNGLGDSPASNMDCTTPPAGPTNLTATGIDQQTINLTWTDNSGVEDGYEVWISYSAYCYYYCYWYSYSIASLPANSTAYTVTGADYTGVYFVVATKDGGYSDFSESVTPTPPPGAASASASAASRTAPRPVPRHRVPPTRRP